MSPEGKQLNNCYQGWKIKRALSRTPSGLPPVLEEVRAIPGHHRALGQEQVLLIKEEIHRPEFVRERSPTSHGEL